MNKISATYVDDRIWLHIDGKIVDYLFDPIEFTIPLKEKKVNLFFFTCTCGVPGCAGWHAGFAVKTSSTEVSWECLEEEREFPVLHLFDRAEYELLQAEVLGMLHAMAEIRSRMPLPDDEYETVGGFMEFSNTAELDAMLERVKDWAERHL